MIVAVSACAAIWIGANLLFDQARGRWQRFNTLWFGTLGALLGIVLHGNGLTVGSGGGVWSWILGPLAGGIAFGTIGFLLAQNDDPQRRRIISIGGFGLIGVAVGLLIREEYQPGVDWLTTVVYTAVLALVGAGISLALKKPVQHGVVIGAAVGWILGYWGGADVGDGTIATAVLGATVPGVLLGLRLSETTNPDLTRRAAIDQGSRSWIFLGPALIFIAVMLVIPAIRTGILSLFDRDSEEFVGLENYVDTFTDDASWDLSDWTNMFTSVPFYIGVVLLAIAVIVGTRSKRQTGRAVELGNPDGGAARGRRTARVFRGLHRGPGNDHQQPVVGRHGHVLLDGAWASPSPCSPTSAAARRSPSRSSSCRWHCRSSVRRSSGASCTRRVRSPRNRRE